MAEDQYEIDHYIDKLVREAEHCVICNCKGDCPGGCSWTETALCSSCYGEKCACCEVRRQGHRSGFCFKCWRRARDIAHEHAGFDRDDAEHDRYMRYINGQEPGRPIRPKGTIIMPN